MSNPVHANNKTKNILVLGEGFTQGLDDTINFSKTNTNFFLSLHYNGEDSYLFVNGKEIHKFKAKDSEIVANSLCLGSISKDLSAEYVKKAGLGGYVNDFSGDCWAIAADKILDIYKYLMEKNNIV